MLRNLNQHVVEDYAKTIYLLAETKSPVTTSRIAKARQVKSASVTGMLKRLDHLGLVHYQKRDGVTLTKAGRKCALETLRHHRLVELYLIEKLGFGWDEVHEQADILEHVIGEKLEERIAAALGNPKYGAYGQPIPNRKGEMIPIEAIPLTDVAAGQTVEVAYIANDTDGELLNYLAEAGILPKLTMSVVEKTPFSGPVIVETDGQEKIVGHKAATMIFVTSQ